MEKNKRIIALDGMKGISAVFIAFFYHYYTHFSSISSIPLEKYLGSFYRKGFLAVELFFMISGFIMYYRYHDNIYNKKINIKKYILNRIKALYPIMVITLMAVTTGQYLYICVAGKTFVDEHFDAIHFFMNLFMLQGSLFNEYSFNLPVWFVSTLFLCYLLFYFLAVIERKINIGGGFSYFVLIFTGWFSMLMHINAPFLGCEFAARGYVTFFLGSLLCKAGSIYKRPKKCWLFLLLLIMTAMFSVFLTKAGLPGQGKIRIILIWIVFPVLLILSSAHNIFSKILEGKPFIWMGKLSNYIFFWHFPIQVFLALILRLYNMDFISGYILMPVYIAAVLLVSYISYYIKTCFINKKVFTCLLDVGGGRKLKGLVDDPKARIEWVDSAKGYGIILVVIAHIGIGRIATSYLNSFYMPLFFFLSGFVFSTKRDFKSFFIRKCKTILIPYFALGIPMVVFVICKEYYLGNGSPDFIIQLILKFLVQRRLWTLWYISCLFGLNIVFYLLIEKVQNIKLSGLLFFVLSILGFIYYSSGGYALPWNIDVIPVAILFFFGGYLFKTKYDCCKNMSGNFLCFMFVITLTFNIAFWLINLKICGQGLEMYFSQYGIPVLTVISAFSGIIAVVLFAHRFKFMAIRYLGQNSLIYYAWHHTIMIPSVRYMLKKMGVKINFISNKPMMICEKLIEFVIIMLLLTLCQIVISKTKLKFMIGK